jgi:hypothetical protein
LSERTNKFVKVAKLSEKESPIPPEINEIIKHGNFVKKPDAERPIPPEMPEHWVFKFNKFLDITL